MKVLKSLYINQLFFNILLGIGGIFFISFFVQWLYYIAIALLIVVLLITFADIFILFSVKNGLEADRQLPERFSNGDDNTVVIHISNLYPLAVKLNVIDEVPFQFQKRNFLHSVKLNGNNKHETKYLLRPTERGEYQFGRLNIYVQTTLGLTSRRYVFSENVIVPTYPSFIQLRKYDLLAFSSRLTEYGIKRIRRIGHTMEFEQIKEYVQGDDIRTINWKASSKRNQLMVNQFQDEKSQPVYQLIDTGRTMQMCFNGLSLLDYSINSTLALANIILKKQDKAGMLTFSKKVDNLLPAERRSGQMEKLMEKLYNIKTDFSESDFSRLYVDIKQTIKQRSVILLYTNFETIDGLRRQLLFLKNIAKNHFLIVIFFDNTELNKIISVSSKNIQEVYDKVIAEKFAFEKRLIVSELEKYGIQTILTQPEDLTINSINKYIELKAKGMI